METYSTMQCTVKVTPRVFTSEVISENEIPFKYIVKDLEGKLLSHIIFKNGDADGITNEDLFAILIERLQTQQEGIKKSRNNGFALARLEESLMWLTK